MKLGLLIGAGASYEVGMPLVNELTNIVKINILKRIHLFDFKDDKNLKEIFIFKVKNMTNYEVAIGELENMYLENHSDILHGIIIQFIECIQLLLLKEQLKIKIFFFEKIEDYYGIRILYEKYKNINIFSLNHDIVFEEILRYFDIPYKDCFYKSENDNYSNLTNFKVLTLAQLEENNIDWYNENEEGINLLKLHGSIDIFTAEDETLLLKIDSQNKDFYSLYDEIEKVENQNTKICQKDKIRMANELTVYDNKGILQFLRRSLLSGEHKFDNKIQQIIPKEFLEIFITKLNNLDELIIIGYSLGDKHINNILFKWLDNYKKRITIYDLYLELSEDFRKYENQISLKKATFTDFCLDIENKKEEKDSKMKREILNKIRDDLMQIRLNN